MLMPVRYGVVSAGRMAGQTMLKIMAGHPAARPVAFYELNPHRPDTAGRIPMLQARQVRCCGSLQELLDDEQVDVVLNATPHYAHSELSIQALHAGHAVVCEKPPACSAEECQAMVAAQRHAGRPLMIHFQHLLRPSARWLNQAICSGAIGAIRRVRCVSLWWRSADYYRRVDWAGKRAYQGRPTLDGTMVNQSVHFLNQMLAFAHRSGESHVAAVKDIRAGLYRFHPAEALEMEDTVVAAGRLDNEDRTEFLFAATTCAADSAGPSRLAEYAGLGDRHSIIIEGERGQAVWNGHASLEVDGREAEVFDSPEGPWPFYFHVQRVLAGQEQPITPIDQAVKTMDFVFAAYLSGGLIRQRDWQERESVAHVLRRCASEMMLPEELTEPPAWA